MRRTIRSTSRARTSHLSSGPCSITSRGGWSAIAGITTPNAKKDFALTSLLVCGNCGRRLTVVTQNGVRYYLCSLYHHSGKAACSSNMIQEEKVVAVLVDKLQAFVFNPKV